MAGEWVTDDEDEEAPDPVELTRTLGEKYNVEILAATDEPLSAQELSEDFDVPIATCYRRIESLEAAGLLTLHDRVLSDERRRVSVYKRDVDGIHLEFDDGLVVETDERDELPNRLDDVWRRLSPSDKDSDSPG
jgi:predicted transcriptional regulator